MENEMLEIEINNQPQEQQKPIRPRKRSSAARVQKMEKGLFMTVMMGPAVIGFLIFYVYVNFSSLIMAFQDKTSVVGEVHYNFNNFSYFFAQLGRGSIFYTAIKNTLIFFLFGYVQMLLSLFVSYFIYKKVTGYKFFRFVYYLPSIIMASVTAILYNFVTITDGPLHMICENLGFTLIDFKTPEYANLWLALYMLLFGLGGNMILFLGSMNNISPEIFEAARLDGVGWLREIFQIIIPLIFPTLSVMVLQTITHLTQASGPVFLLSSGIPETHTINYWLFNNLMKGIDLERSAAVGWCCTLVTFPLAMLTKHYLDKAEEKLGA